MKRINIYSKISLNYEFFANIFCILYYIFGHFIVIYVEYKNCIRIIFKLYL